MADFADEKREAQEDRGRAATRVLVLVNFEMRTRSWGPGKPPSGGRLCLRAQGVRREASLRVPRLVPQTPPARLIFWVGSALPVS